MKGCNQYLSSSCHKRVKIGSDARYALDELSTVERYQSPVGVFQAVGQEPKLVVVVDGGNNVVVGLNGIDQGSENDDRSSMVAELISCSVRGVVRVPLTKGGDLVPASNLQLCRVLLVLDTQCNGATIPDIASDVLTGLNAASGEDVIFWFANRANTHRYKILKDEVFNLKSAYRPYISTPGWGYVIDEGSTTPGTSFANTVGSYTGGDQKVFDWHVDFENLIVNFSGALNNIGSMVDNALHLIAFDMDSDGPRVQIQCMSKCVYRTESK